MLSDLLGEREGVVLVARSHSCNNQATQAKRSGVGKLLPCRRSYPTEGLTLSHWLASAGSVVKAY